MTQRKQIRSIAKRYQNRVRDCRLRALIHKQEDLARMTGINRSTINALENNKIFLSSHYALILTEALNCRLDDLFEKKNNNLEIKK